MKPILPGLFAALTMLAVPLFAHAQAATPTPLSTPPPISYYGVYLAKSKLGSATIVRNTHAVLNGKPAIRTEMRMTMAINVGGVPGAIETSDISWTDSRSGEPLAAENRTVASGRVTDVKTTYAGNTLTYIADVQGTKKTDTITLPAGEHFLVDPTDGENIKPTVGMKFHGKVFVADLFKVIDAEIEVVGKETVTVDGTALPAFKILDRNSLETSTLFETEDGDLLRIDDAVAGVPMQIRKEAKEIALAPAGAGPSPDLITLTSIRPTGETLVHARSAHAITYRLSGVTRELPVADTVESVTYGADPASTATNPTRDADITVRALPLPPSPAASLFARPADAPESLRPYLQSTPYVAAGDPTFSALAQTILRGETDSVRAAKRISAYVHRTVKPDPSIAAMRSATDVCNDPRGVCRDYTTFFTAIARSAGLPTKQCVGIAFDGQSFVGHAWPEVWVGKDPVTHADHWVAIEPTWGLPFADATHIKLAEGEITDFFTVAADLGKYGIEVLKVE